MDEEETKSEVIIEAERRRLKWEGSSVVVTTRGNPN
jgi:hypothetical protein